MVFKVSLRSFTFIISGVNLWFVKATNWLYNRFKFSLKDWVFDWRMLNLFLNCIIANMIFLSAINICILKCSPSIVFFNLAISMPTCLISFLLFRVSILVRLLKFKASCISVECSFWFSNNILILDFSCLIVADSSLPPNNHLKALEIKDLFRLFWGVTSISCSSFIIRVSLNSLSSFIKSSFTCVEISSNWLNISFKYEFLVFATKSCGGYTLSSA